MRDSSGSPAAGGSPIGEEPMGKRGKKAVLYVGTSGWSYDWEGFYPPGLRSREYLSYYSRRFGTVEVNYSFYRLPRPSTYEKWRDETSDDFVFALKLSRFITHVKKLSGVGDALRKFLARAVTLGPKLGPVLVQLPPSFRADTERLARFLELSERVQSEMSMGSPLRVAFELRHPTWLERPGAEAAVDTMKRYGAAVVFAHSSRYPYPETEPVTGDFIYLRFHGPGEMFASRYGKAGLERWRPKMRDWLERGLDVYAYFNNDVHGYAVGDATALLELAGG
jgi:uncharacterized protein YecE (DUF72 family)